MPHRSTAVEWLVFLALGIAWGSSYLFIKIGIETLSPFTLIAARTAIGAAVLALVMVLSREHLPRAAGTWGHMFVVALLGIAIPFSLITWGERSIDSALAAILNGTVPLLAIVLAAIVLVDEPITLNRLLGLVVGFAGVIAITSPNFGSGMAGSLPGELALMGASVSYAAAGVYARRTVRDLAPLPSAFLEVGLAFLVMLVLAFAFEDPLVTRVEPSTVLAVGWLGLVGSGLAFLAFFFLLGHWGAGRTSTVAYLLPVVGILLGVVVRHEVLSAPVLLGTALVIGGVAVANSGFGQRRLFGREPTPVAREGTVQAGD
ncbi:MAG: DMT family transporter [Chloroflexota bacterium]|nr:DMT family transporter [Chloroflexota bacterium]